MAKEQLNNYTYGEMLVSPGYDVDFAIGTTYSESTSIAYHPNGIRFAK